MEIDVYTINDKDYLLIDKIDNYLYLSNENDENDMLILKENSNDKETLLPLDNEDEYKKALALFTSKMMEEEI